MSASQGDSSRSLDRSIQEVTYTPDFNSIFRQPSSKDMAGGRNATTVPSYITSSQPPQHRDYTASPLINSNVTCNNTSIPQQCSGSFDNPTVLVDATTNRVIAPTSQPQVTNSHQQQQQQQQQQQHHHQQQQQPTQRQSPSARPVNLIPHYQRSQPQQQQQQQYQAQPQQQQHQTSSNHVQQVHLNNGPFLQSDNQLYANQASNLPNIIRPNQTNNHLYADGARRLAQIEQPQMPLCQQPQINNPVACVNSLPLGTYQLYSTSTATATINRPNVNTTHTYSRQAPVIDTIQISNLANPQPQPIQATGDRRYVITRTPQARYISQPNQTTSPQPCQGFQNSYQYQPTQYAPRFQPPTTAHQQQPPQQQQISLQPQQNFQQQSYQQQQQQTQIDQHSSLASLLSSAPCSRTVADLLAQGIAQRLEPQSSTDTSQNYRQPTILNHQQARSRPRHSAPRKQISNQQQNIAVVNLEDHAYGTTNKDNLDRSSLVIQQPIQPPPQTVINGTHDRQSAPDTTNSRIPVSVAVLRSRDAEVQVKPDNTNKGCQFNSMMPTMVNRSMMATVSMVDANCQTDPIELEEKVKKTYVDRGSSPINFPPPDIPVRKKFTAKRRKVELEPQPEKSTSDTETDIDVEE